jgi:hypothetical protein
MQVATLGAATRDRFMTRTIIAALCIAAAFPALAEKRTLYCTVVGALDTRVGDDGTHSDGQFVAEPQGVRATWIFEDNTLQIQSSDPDIVRSGTFECEPYRYPDTGISGVLCRRQDQLAKFTGLPIAWTYTAKMVPGIGRMQRLESFSCMDKDFGPPGEWLHSPSG